MEQPQAELYTSIRKSDRPKLERQPSFMRTSEISVTEAPVPLCRDQVIQPYEARRNDMNVRDESIDLPTYVLLIYEALNLSIFQSIHLSIYQYISLSINLSIYKFIYLSIYQFTNL